MALENGTIDDAVSVLAAFQCILDEEEEPEKWKIKFISEATAKKIKIRSDDGTEDKTLFEEFSLCTKPTVLACSEW